MKLNYTESLAILILLSGSMAALLYAPALMHENYDWITHTTSESGAQGISGAWVARSGFVLYGLAVLMLTLLIRKKWSIITTLSHIVFGICMIGNALFSSKPWDPALPFDVLQDTLHSWMSGLVGAAFTIGVLLVFFQRSQADWITRSFDIFAILVSIGISVTMLGTLGINGLLQRFMFLVSYLWYAKEAILIMNLKRQE